MSVAVLADATSEDRREGVVDVHHVQTALAGVPATGGIGESCFFIQGDGMRATETVVMSIFRKSDRRRGHVSQPRQVKYLHAMIVGFAHDEGVIRVDLNSTPKRIAANG